MFHANNGKTLNYTGKPLPEYGSTLKEADGLLCHHGLHASPLPSMAHSYNPGPFLDLVDISGANSHIGSNKVAATIRIRLATIDMREVSIFVQQQEVLRRFDERPDSVLDTELNRIIEFVMNPTLENAIKFHGATIKKQPSSWNWSGVLDRAMMLADIVLLDTSLVPRYTDEKLFDDECVLRFQKMGYPIHIVG